MKVVSFFTLLILLVGSFPVMVFSCWASKQRILRPYDTRFNEIDKPQGPPYVLDRPGKLSFSLGPLRFRQPVYDQVRNSEPFVLRPGKLSFRIGPLKFYQIPAQSFHYYPCCVDVQANCYNLVDCNED
eukprot:09050.XXX_446832_447270_1 [CDS] Oithona nana genome sequencing.